MVPSDSLALRFLIPFLALSLMVAVTLSMGPVITVTITPPTFTVACMEAVGMCCQLSSSHYTFWLSFFPVQYSSAISRHSL